LTRIGGLTFKEPETSQKKIVDRFEFQFVLKIWFGGILAEAMNQNQSPIVSQALPHLWSP
jgi:hypothetical protein